jgi:hypothetical protein
VVIKNGLLLYRKTVVFPRAVGDVAVIAGPAFRKTLVVSRRSARRVQRIPK